MKLLRSDPHAAIRMPSDEEVEEFKVAFGTKHLMLHNVYCVPDGLKYICSSHLTALSKTCSTTDGCTITTLETCSCLRQMEWLLHVRLTCLERCMILS